MLKDFLFTGVDRGLLPILLAVGVMAFGMSFVFPLIPLVIRDTGASFATIGQVTSVYFIAFTLVTIPIGKWIERYMPKRLILLGLFLYGISIASMIFPARAEWFYLIRIIQGIGAACLFVSTESAINVLSSPERRSSNMGLYATVFALGMALGPPIGTWLYTVSTSMPFLLCFSVSVVSIAIITVGFHDMPVHQHAGSTGLKNIAALITVPLTAALCYAVVEVSVVGFLSLYLKELNISSASLGFIFTLFGIGGIISPFPAGKAADRYGKLNLLYLLGVLLVIVSLAFNFIRSYNGIAILTTGVGIIAGGLYPIALSLIADLVPEQNMGTGNAVFSLSFGIGCIIGPLATGWMIDLEGIDRLFYPMTAATLIFIIVALVDARVKATRNNVIQ